MRDDDAESTEIAPGTSELKTASLRSPERTSASDEEPVQSVPVPQVEPGARIGRYVLERAIGEGGMGVVYEAYDRELHRSVAIKLLSPRTPMTSEVWQERFLREARAMARVSHPNVVPVYDIGAHGHQIFIAMELVDGLSLRPWLKLKPRGWREIVDVFRQVGRGLAAAHDVGLVHRDVKPDNILIGNDGRARLTDFGVVKEVGDATDTSGEVSDPGSSGEGMRGFDRRPSQPLGPDLTRFGVIVGTLSYMAPEQIAGYAAGPRTDQFSFCATFHRALYGVNPCKTRDPKQPEQWRMPDAPEGSQVPPWVRRILVRGLSNDPGARYPSMHALLDDLMEPRRKRVIPIAVAVVAAGVAIPLVARDGKRECPDERAKLVGVWDPTVKQTVRSAFLAIRKPYAEASYRSVERSLDAYVESWSKMQAASCEIADRDGVRRDCLTRRLDDLRAQTELFAKADERAVELAVDAAGSLIDPVECSHATVSSTSNGEPARELRKQLSAAKALEDLGQYKEGIAVTRTVVAQARALPDDAIEAEALYQLGELQRRNGDTAAAATLEQAIVTAVASRHDEVAARAWIRLASVVGIQKGQAEEGLRVAEHGRAFIKRLGGDKRLEAMLAGDLSIIYRRLGRYDESLKQSDIALELGEQIYGPHHSQVGSWINSSGLTLLEAGKLPEARTRFQRALAIFEREYGSHPRVATVYVNMGLERFRSGDYAEAVLFAKRALEIDERDSGQDNAKLISTLNLIGSAQSELGQHDEGIAALQRAVGIAESLPAQNHKRLAAEISLGISYNRAGRFKEALPILEKGLAVIEQRGQTSDPSDLAETQFALGVTADALGDKERGHALVMRARDGFVAAGDKMKRQLAELEAWVAAHTPNK